jgi:hypothetical protein
VNSHFGIELGCLVSNKNCCKIANASSRIAFLEPKEGRNQPMALQQDHSVNNEDN